MARNPYEAMLEEHIVHYLTFSNKYHFHPTSDYDRNACLIKEDLIAFLKTTQARRIQFIGSQCWFRKTCTGLYL